MPLSTETSSFADIVQSTDIMNGEDDYEGTGET
jgi:hypothetical protein